MREKERKHLLMVSETRVFLLKKQLFLFEDAEL